MAKKNGTTTEEPLEKQLWKAADKLRKNAEDRDEYHAENVFFVPQEARWEFAVKR